MKAQGNHLRRNEHLWNVRSLSNAASYSFKMSHHSFTELLGSGFQSWCFSSVSRTCVATGRPVKAARSGCAGFQCLAQGGLCPPRDSVGCVPSSLQSGDLYPEGPGHDPATVPTVCPLTAGSNDMLDPKSWLLSLALASSREGALQTGQLVHSRGLDFVTRPADTDMAESIATLIEPSPTGGSSPDRPWVSAQRLYLLRSLGSQK